MAFQQVKKKMNKNLQLTQQLISSLVENTTNNNNDTSNANSMDLDLSDNAFDDESDLDFTDNVIIDNNCNEIKPKSSTTSINNAIDIKPNNNHTIDPQKVLKECTKILLEIENDKLEQDKQITSDEFEHILKERHNAYCQRKQTKNEKALPLHEFVAACAITADQKSDKPFLFEKTKLSFTIMCSNWDASQGEPIINRLQFEKWATKLYPLATKQNYQRYVLCQYIFIFILALNHLLS